MVTKDAVQKEMKIRQATGRVGHDFVSKLVDLFLSAEHNEKAILYKAFPALHYAFFVSEGD